MSRNNTMITNLPKIKNKKADLSVVAFVLLVLLLCTYTLYSMTANRRKVSTTVSGFEQIEELLLEKKDIEYRLLKTTEECFIESYKEFVETGLILEPPLIALGGTTIFEELNLNTKEDYLEKIKTCLNKKGQEKHRGLFAHDDDFFKDVLFSRLKNNQFTLSPEYKITLNNFPLTRSEENLKYLTTLNAEINLEKIGLIDFKKIEEAIECKKNKECIDSITKSLFEVQIEKISFGEEDNKEYYLNHTFKSKKEFLIGNEFKNIEFSFLTHYEELEEPTEQEAENNNENEIPSEEELEELLNEPPEPQEP
jgi:hypothetical protein